MIFLSANKLYRMQITISTAEARKTTYLCVTMTLFYLMVSLLDFLGIYKIDLRDLIALCFIFIYKSFLIPGLTLKRQHKNGFYSYV